MIIGIPNECMRDEDRVGMMPSQVAQLVAEGHRVLVETGAGTRAGFADEHYRASGAQLCTKEDAFHADLTVKVKCPLPNEYGLLRKGGTLFAYLHFDGNAPAEDITAMVTTGTTCIAYEWVEENGRYPLLEPMSRITGVLFARRAMELLLMGRKHVGGGYGLGSLPARAMVVGAGHIGANAIQVFARNDVRLVVVDKHPETLNLRMRGVWPQWSSACLDRVIAFDEQKPEVAVRQIQEELPRTDILIGAAVRRESLPRSRLNYLVDREALSQMQPGSILCDATANIRDFFETAIPTLGLHETYEESDVVHYNCEHLPSMAARTSTQLLTAATFPYVRQLANGVDHALRHSTGLQRGTMCHSGLLTDALTAQNKNLGWTALIQIL